MALRVVQPATVRLSLSDGDWVEVRERLNHGEHHALMEALYFANDRGELIRQPHKWAHAIVTAYLVDWSLSTLAIRGQSREDVSKALNLLEHENFTEIQDAIEAHASRVAAERAEKKRARLGDSGLSTTSLSLVGAPGATNG